MNSKNKKSSARALFVGHLGAVGLGSIMDIPDDAGMQWSMYVHRVRSEDTTHTHTMLVLPLAACAFLLRSSEAGRRRRRTSAYIRRGLEDFGSNHSAPGLVRQVVRSVSERSLSDECDGQDVHATETWRKDKHKNALGPARDHPPSTRRGTAVCSPCRWGLDDKQRNIAKGWTRSNTRNAARACACAAVEEPPLLAAILRQICGVATLFKADRITWEEGTKAKVKFERGQESGKHGRDCGGGLVGASGEGRRGRHGEAVLGVAVGSPWREGRNV